MAIVARIRWQLGQKAPINYEREGPQSNRQTRTCTIVILEPQTSFLDWLYNMLQTTPEFDVVGSANTFADGLEQVKQLKPDLVLSDVWLPGAQGLDFLYVLQSLEMPPRIVVMAMDPEVGPLVEKLGLGFVLKTQLSVELLRAWCLP